MMRLHFVGLAALCVGCGTGINGGPAINLNPILSGSVSGATAISFDPEFKFFSMPGIGASFATITSTVFNVGANKTEQLKSLQFYFMQVQICESIEVNGTSYNNPLNCTTLYHHSVDPDCLNKVPGTGEDGGKTDGECEKPEGDENEAYESYGLAEATADKDPNHYMEMTDIVTVRQKLNKATTAKPGTYNFGLINWFRPVKVNAEVTLNNGKTLVTRSGLTPKFNDGSFYTNISGNSLVGTAGTSEESVVMMNNGGAFFKFQQPFVYEGTEKLTLDLVYNPDSIIKGSTNVSNYAILDSSSNGINVPMLQLTPVVHKESEAAMKETYMIYAARANIRVELYYVDSNRDSIMGVDMRAVYTDASGGGILDPSQVMSMVTNGDGSIDFRDYQGVSFFPDFKRLSSEGDVGTLSFNCATQPSLYGYCVDQEQRIIPGSVLSLKYKLIRVSSVR